MMHSVNLQLLDGKLSLLLFHLQPIGEAILALWFHWSSLKTWPILLVNLPHFWAAYGALKNRLLQILWWLWELLSQIPSPVWQRRDNPRQLMQQLVMSQGRTPSMYSWGLVCLGPLRQLIIKLSMIKTMKCHLDLLNFRCWCFWLLPSYALAF